MKQGQLSKGFIPVILTLGGLCLSAGMAIAEPIAIRPNSNYRNNFSGQSGGNIHSRDCGYVSSSPSYVLNLQGDISSMTISLRSQSRESTMTMLINGPDGRFCIRTLNGVAESSGLWPAGRYELYIGDRPNQRNKYNLSISQ